MNNKESGVSFIAVLILTVLLMGTAAVTMSFAPIMLKTSINDENSALAVHTADSGLQYAIAWIKDPANASKTLADFRAVFGTNASYASATWLPVDSYGKFYVTREDRPNDDGSVSIILNAYGLYWGANNKEIAGSNRAVNTTLKKSSGSGGSEGSGGGPGSYALPGGAATLVIGSGSSVTSSVVGGGTITGNVIISNPRTDGGKLMSFTGGSKVTGKLLIPAGTGISDIDLPNWGTPAEMLDRFITEGLGVAPSSSDTAGLIIPPPVPAKPTVSNVLGSLTTKWSPPEPPITQDGRYSSINVVAPLNIAISSDRIITIDGNLSAAQPIRVPNDSGASGSGSFSLFVDDTISISSNALMTINSAKDSIVVTKNLSLNGQIKNIGAGKLYIYVTDTLTLSQGSIGSNSNTDATKVAVFYLGTSTLNVANNIRITGALWAAKADVTIGNGGVVTGSVIAKSLRMDGGSQLNISNTGPVVPPGTGGGGGTPTFDEGPWNSGSSGTP